jgi:pimeloyl-ACP methyl ester carboxylesterase
MFSDRDRRLGKLLPSRSDGTRRSNRLEVAGHLREQIVLPSPHEARLGTMVRVRFCVSPKGHRIAFVDEGTGPLLVFPPKWVSHLELEAHEPAYARFFSELARRFRVVRYDRPGTGLSDRGHTDYSVDSEVSDLSALIDHLGADHVNVCAGSCATIAALAYAARYPERMAKLVVLNGYLDGESLAPPEPRRAIIALVRASWGLGSKTLVEMFHPNAGAEVQRHFKAIQRASADGETAARLLEFMYASDARAFVAKVRTPTLVVHRKGDRAMRLEEGRKLAAALPDATFVSLEGDCHLPWHGDQDLIIDVMRSFLLGGTEQTRPHTTDDGAELRRDGEVWTVEFADRRVLIKDNKGLADIARLLTRPGDDVHVLELAGASVDQRRVLGRGQPALDRGALEAYRKRLSDLDGALREAEARGDAQGSRKLGRERDLLVRRLAADTGLGGRVRLENDPVERARKAVTARIRDAIRRIQSVHPALGGHLAATIVTGVHCAYRPPRPVRWKVAAPF